MLCVEKSPYNLRKKSGSKRQLAPTRSDCVIDKKRLRNFDHIGCLPVEILLYIFDHLDIEHLYYNVRLVCRKWHRISMLSSAWRRLSVDNSISSHILGNWIRLVPVIKHFRIRDRNDADEILGVLSPHYDHLESISIENCWGSNERIPLQSKTLCKLMTKCKNLTRINFERVKIRSCKFFKLLTKRRHNEKCLRLRYVGPVTPKQYDTLRASCPGWIFTEVIEIL